MPTPTLRPETILETDGYGLRETKAYALDAVQGKPLFFAASALDAAFSALGPVVSPNVEGAAYASKIALEAQYNEQYAIILEGGQVPSDFATGAELAAIAAYVAPYLTGQPYSGGVPIRAGYLLTKRTVNTWTIQRGKGFSLQGAIDAGYVAGLPSPFFATAPPASQEVGGFIVSGGGLTFPAQSPGGVSGMPNGTIIGYPATGGSNISQPTPIAGVVSINTVNNDGTINAAIETGFFIDGLGVESNINPGRLDAGGKSPIDWWNFMAYSNPYALAGNFFTGFPPQWSLSSPDYTANFDPSFPPGGGWTWTWNGTNAQVLTIPFVLIFWLGQNIGNIPNVVYELPISPANPPAPPLPDSYKCAPADLNAPLNPFTAADYDLFWLK